MVVSMIDAMSITTFVRTCFMKAPSDGVHHEISGIHEWYRSGISFVYPATAPGHTLAGHRRCSTTRSVPSLLAPLHNLPVGYSFDPM